MCGRTACLLTPPELCQACSHNTEWNKKYKVPEWRDEHQTAVYTPSYNMCPTQASPVLVSKMFFHPDSNAYEKLLIPMLWGYVPDYYTGSFASHGLKTNNCRSEGMCESSMFSKPFYQGRRCAVLCNGFYEWQKVGDHKQPYFIYLPQPEGVCLKDRTTWNVSWDEDQGWRGPRLLPMAGLFGQWTSPEGEKIWNYTVVTMPASPSFEAIHKRMPVILDQDWKIEHWLTGNIEMARSVVRPPEELKKHPVTAAVGNTRFNEPACLLPIDLKAQNKAAASKHGSAKLMANWLAKKSKPASKFCFPDPDQKD